MTRKEINSEIDRLLFDIEDGVRDYCGYHDDCWSLVKEMVDYKGWDFDLATGLSGWRAEFSKLDPMICNGVGYATGPLASAKAPTPELAVAMAALKALKGESDDTQEEVLSKLLRITPETAQQMILDNANGDDDGVNQQRSPAPG